MSEAEKQAVLVICLYAAFADGAKHDRERAELQRVAESLAPETGTGFAGLYQDVLLKRRTLAQAVAELRTLEVRQLAYELSVCVCGADGACSRDESLFLDRLRGLLGIEAARAEDVVEEAAAVAEVPLADAGTVAPISGGGRVPESMILNYAILAGAIELLPQTLASMAIIPLQMKMVYRIGKAHGFELDRGHIKDLLATLGAGLTSQYLEGFGRKLLGGLLGGALGGIGRSVGRAGAGAAFSFATTYAIGKAAEAYYAGGRRFDAGGLQSLFATLLGEGKALQQQLAPQIAQRARNLDASDLAALVRGS